MLTIKPVGRGNWRPVVLAWPDNDDRTVPLVFCVGDTFELGRRVWRICRVSP